MDPAAEHTASVAFGRFRALPHRRELLADGRPIKIGGRAFDVLMALIEARGAVVGKEALMARVWPDRVVEENNLQAHISALRAALGAERELIRTVSGRGTSLPARSASCRRARTSTPSRGWLRWNLKRSYRQPTCRSRFPS
jgi:DNA-binding winged helix-turn-helix (wHTH) protein